MISSTDTQSAGPDLRSVFRHVASTVAVITTRYEGADFGMTATSVTSVSMQPPTILACANRASRLHSAVTSAGRYCVNFLAEDQADIAKIFGTPDHAHRFSFGTWSQSSSGPLLAEAAAQLICELTASYQVGTHSILIGAVLSATPSGKPPLLYCDGGYARLSPA